MMRGEDKISSEPSTLSFMFRGPHQQALCVRNILRQILKRLTRLSQCLPQCGGIQTSNGVFFWVAQAYS